MAPGLGRTSSRKVEDGGVKQTESDDDCEESVIRARPAAELTIVMRLSCAAENGLRTVRVPSPRERRGLYNNK